MADYVFFLSEGDRANIIQQMMQSFGCTYICLWSYHPSNCLKYIDGFYHERNNNPQSASSSATHSQGLFDLYGLSTIMVDSSFVPGLAFLSKNSYLVLPSTVLQRMASLEIQCLFYQNAIFVGCSSGEIELGFGDDSSQLVNLEMEMRTWFSQFSEDFSRRQYFAPTAAGDLLPVLQQQQPPNTTTDQNNNNNNNRPASSSSSLRSLSYDDSSEYSPILLDIPSASYLNVPENQQQGVMIPTMAATNQQQQQQSIFQSLSQIRSAQLPTIESEDDAMTRAILAVISSADHHHHHPASSSTTTSSGQLQQPSISRQVPVGGSQASAFRGYYRPTPPALAPRNNNNIIPAGNRRQNMLKRCFAFLSDLYSSSMRTQGGQTGRTSSTQLHHMISERRRREKQNESFQRLRSLLPPGTKKDKASVLTSTTEHLKALKAKVDELSRINQILEAQLLFPERKSEVSVHPENSVDQRVEVHLLTNNVVAASASTSTARFVDLQVIVRGYVSVTDLVIRLLEFLKTDRNLNLLCVEAETRVSDTSALANNVTMRLRIEGGEWDESTFRETIRRVVNDLVEKP
ncbi:OLC1v1037734C4 [Oldenlandia corymbosa var. corymbosa]|uniref:OLC1v1037734C4 n=1 Tax=Oldenlandia corymbosa var. corymbosa TaxID=529605 RepID=A0AAV1CY22_OLDCO|nr:OLC1v1037734C4 [Oldenlandia corymbosa var. corymbosa]